MASRRTPDLDCLLEDPVEARKFISSFNWYPTEPPKYVVFGLENKIYLGAMTDEEAVLAAKIILYDVHIPKVMRELQYESYTH